jgi:hypothetical protein
MGEKEPERITVVLCMNNDDGNKQVLIVTGKSLKPRFKNTKNFL